MNVISRCAIAWLIAALGAAAIGRAAHGQIVMRSIDPRRMQTIPLAKEAYPGMPYLPKPRLPNENIRPPSLSFDMIPKENLVQPNIRPNRLEAGPPVVNEKIVQEPIAPRWLERNIQGPERLMPQPTAPRDVLRNDFEYRRPQFETRTIPRPGWEGPMFLTPSFFADRPIDPDLSKSAPVRRPPSTAEAQAAPDGRRPLGW